jgi:hypothetical protein
MHLLKPLALESGRVEKIDLTNTNDGVTVVLLAEAICNADKADIVGLGWLFDDHGNLNPFSGTVVADGELSGPEVAFLTRSGQGNMSFKAAKVAHIRVTKDKEDVMMSMRVHLPKTDDDGVLEVLRQLLLIKKSEIDITVTDAQGSLFDGNDGTPAEPAKLATLDFHSEVGRKGELRASVQLHHNQETGRWYYGWSLTWTGPGMPPAAAMIVDTNGSSWVTERMLAIEAAGSLLITILKDQEPGYSVPMLQASAKLMDWLLTYAPGLRKEPDGSPVSNGAPKVTVMPPPPPRDEELASGLPPAKRGAGRRGPKNREQVH